MAMERKAMDRKPIIIAVIGRKNSGKTTVVERVVRELTQKRYRVATAKHVSQKGFSIDKKGKDTWKHVEAGANPVISVSDAETAVLIKNKGAEFSLEQIVQFTSESNIVVLEGFSHLIQSHERVSKIICVRNRREYNDFSKITTGTIIAYCSINPMEKPILNIGDDMRIIVQQTVSFVKRKQKSAQILSQLPQLDCTKCEYSSCEEMAEAISRKEAEMVDCLTLKLKSKLRTKIVINDAELPIQPFVSEIVRSTLLGMISTLKGASINGDENVHVQILRQSRDAGINKQT